MEEVGGYDPHEVEDKMKEYWEESRAYEQVKEVHNDDPKFYFLDGPPYTSGRVHLGTTWNKLLKDTMIRYLRMQGYDVHDRPGYDMHGLPIEVKVEEKLNIENKGEIEELGVGEFIEECQKFAEDNLNEMNKDFKRMGIWMDWDNPYKTLDDSYMEGVWWAFKNAYKKGLVENGEEVVNQCPRCETSLADAEVEYEEIESPSIYVKIPLKKKEGNIVIWTTTPWTLPANLYVAIDEETEYKKIKATKDNRKEEILYIASECVEEVLKKGRYKEYETLSTLKGEELIGFEYRHPLIEEVPKQQEFSDGTHKIYPTDFVELERTGLVHCAPGHGFEDFEAAQDLELPVFSPVEGNGVYTKEAGKYSGKKIPEVDNEIIEDLEKKDLLLASEKHRHRYGHCWRCDTPIIYISKDQWFLRITEIKDKLLDEIDRTKWSPSWAKDSRFRDWVENARDWNVSRQRYWGIPIPIWICEDGHETCIGSREELKQKSPNNIKKDLHRPYVDNIKIECECGKTAKRIKDVFDVWLDSAAASWSSLDYPLDEKKFEELFPPELIIEAHDQTRGWFWSQLGLGVAAIDEVPYRNVVMHGHVLDEDGRKMSKSLGNVIEPGEVIEEYGIDPLRVFLLSRNPHGDDVKFSYEGVEQKHRELNVLWNVYRFPLPYMILDSFDPEEKSIEDVNLTDIDKWILSRLQSVKKEIENSMDKFEINKAQESLLSFIVEDVSRFYVQSVRPRMWEEEESQDKLASYVTIYKILNEVSKLLAPFAPHIAESIYQNLRGGSTVHSLEIPDYEGYLHDNKLEEDIDIMRKVEEAIRNARQKAERNVRWPVKRVIIETEEERVKNAIESKGELLKERINSRSIEIVENWSEMIEVAEPKMDAIGPRFKERAGEIAKSIKGSTREELKKTEGGESRIIVNVNGKKEKIDEEMIEFKEKTPENIEKSEFETGKVYLDISSNKELESEGYTREVVRRIQEMRKELELDMEEKINVSLDIKNEEVNNMVKENIDYIEKETRSQIFNKVENSDLKKKWDIKETNVIINIETI